MSHHFFKIFSFLVILASLLLGGCFSTPAIEARNICSLLDDKVSWYKAVKASSIKYDVPMHLQLAIIHQESRFKSNARPFKFKFFDLFSFPGNRTSAFGFAQVQDTTWKWYKSKIKDNSVYRDNFEDATHFIAWYIVQSHKRLNISKEDHSNQYLAYHEGHNGFRKGNYKKKPWLLEVSKKVSKQADLYQRQLAKCRSQLDSNGIWSF